MIDRRCFALACFVSACFAVAGWAPLPSAYAADGELFDRLDGDQDGFISPKEVDEEKRALYDRLLRTADEDEDGKLSRKEFAAGLAGRPASDRRPTGPPTGGRPDAKAFFDRLDEDGDGKLTRKEVPERMRQFFDRVDTDGDKAVDAREFAVAAARRVQGQQRPAAAVMVERIFKQRDENGDGKLSLNEVPEERREFFRRVIERLDDDGDGAITREQAGQALRMLAGGRPGAGPAAGVEAVLKRLKQADENDDDKLSREEAPERLKANFDRIDTDGDGQIDEAEVRRMLQQFRQDSPRPRQTDKKQD